MILKAILQFCCNIMLIKMDSTVICMPCMLEHVCYEPFSLKVKDLADILR